MKSPAEREAPLVKKEAQAALLAPPPFPIDALPEKTLQVVAAIHELTKAPVPLIVSSVLSALSMATLGRYRIQHQDGQITVPSLFMINIFDAGNLKNEAVSKAFAGIQQAERAKNDSARKRGSDQVKAATSQAKAKASPDAVGQEPQNPTCQSVHLPTLAKSTPVALGPVPATPPTCQLIYPDFDNELKQAVAKRQHIAFVINTEADQVFAAGALPYLDRFCSGWDCHDLREPDEVTRFKNLSSSPVRTASQVDYVKDVRWSNTHISAYLCVRSQALHSHVEGRPKSAGAYGFLERSLFSIDIATCNEPKLDHDSGEKNVQPLGKALLVLDDFKKKTLFTVLQETEYTVKLDQFAALVSEKSLEQYQSFWSCHDSLPGLKAYLSYQNENILRIAFLLHHMEHSGNHGQLRDHGLYIGEECLNSAVKLILWHSQVYLELFSPGGKRPSELQADTERLETWLAQRHLKGVMTAPPNLICSTLDRNSVLRSGPFRGRGAAQRLDQALEQLIKQGKVITANPALPNGKKGAVIQVCAENDGALKKL